MNINKSLNEYSTIDDIDKNCINEKFSLHITIPYFFTKSEVEQEAVKIHSLIQNLSNYSILQSEISITRYRKRNLSVRETVYFENISNISIENVKNKIDKSWFR